MRILKEQTIGLVIDIQERLLPHIAAHEEILHNTTILLEGLKVLEIPVLLTEQYRKGLGPTVDLVQNSLASFDPMEKMTFSCCDDKEFEAALKNSGKKNVIICGIETHVCVLQTTIDMLEQGYQPVVVADCVSSRKIHDKEIAIERMRSEGAIISSYESILFELTRVSGTEMFKAISRLVK
ncbi:hydrolase [Bacteroidota bacterium]